MKKEYFEKEKKYIKSIEDGGYHRIERDKWLSSKRILDRILKLLPRIGNKKNIKVSLNTNILSPREKELLESVLTDAKKSKVLNYSPKIVKRKALPSVIDIIVFEGGKFEEYRKPIREICDFIENDGMDRFPDKYASTIKVREGLKVKMKIYISNEEGIYRDCGEKKLAYPIKGKRARMIRNLDSGKKPGPFLAKLFTNTNLQQLNNEISDINKNFQDILKVNKKIIKHFKTGGYDLNHEEYEFIFQ